MTGSIGPLNSNVNNRGMVDLLSTHILCNMRGSRKSDTKEGPNLVIVFDQGPKDSFVFDYARSATVMQISQSARRVGVRLRLFRGMNL